MLLVGTEVGKPGREFTQAYDSGFLSTQMSGGRENAQPFPHDTGRAPAKFPNEGRKPFLRANIKPGLDFIGHVSSVLQMATCITFEGKKTKEIYAPAKRQTSIPTDGNCQ